MPTTPDRLDTAELLELRRRARRWLDAGAEQTTISAAHLDALVHEVLDHRARPVRVAAPMLLDPQPVHDGPPSTVTLELKVQLDAEHVARLVGEYPRPVAAQVERR